MGYHTIKINNWKYFEKKNKPVLFPIKIIGFKSFAYLSNNYWNHLFYLTHQIPLTKHEEINNAIQEEVCIWQHVIKTWVCIMVDHITKTQRNQLESHGDNEGGTDKYFPGNTHVL